MNNQARIKFLKISGAPKKDLHVITLTEAFLENWPRREHPLAELVSLPDVERFLHNLQWKISCNGLPEDRQSSNRSCRQYKIYKYFVSHFESSKSSHEWLRASQPHLNRRISYIAVPPELLVVADTRRLRALWRAEDQFEYQIYDRERFLYVFTLNVCRLIKLWTRQSTIFKCHVHSCLGGIWCLDIHYFQPRQSNWNLWSF